MKIPYNDLNIVWVSNYYDYPIEGICRQKGELMKFTVDDNDYLYNLESLTPWQKFKWLFNKKMFEICVGYHWSYQNNARQSFFYYRKPEWLFRFLFKAYFKFTDWFIK